MNNQNQESSSSEDSDRVESCYSSSDLADLIIQEQLNSQIDH